MRALQRGPILQAALTDPPWALPAGTRLPGTGQIAADDWLRRDDAFAGQMALRDRLIADRVEAVHALRPEALLPAQELLRQALGVLATRPGYLVAPEQVTRPDGVVVRLDDAAPLLTLGRLVQEDLCILQQQGEEHVLTGAILCFPASWTLDEKIGRPLIGIHRGVPEYDPGIAKRVQRLFDAIRVGRPMVRANCLTYQDAALFQPRRENDPRVQTPQDAAFVRSERQCLLRLPDSGAVVFTIHTSVVARAGMPAPDRAALENHLKTGMSP